MIDPIPNTHPYWCIRSFALERLANITSFQFSYYEYIPQSLLDNRTIFYLSIKDFIEPSLIEKLVHETPPGCELAFHSCVKTNANDQKHIPMVDMSTGSVAQLEKLKPFLGSHLFHQFKWYKSGRSFHGYGQTLVSIRDWTALLGTLLLANQKGLSPTVDPRWVGHRLIAGYAALRWTKSTPHYIGLPKEIK